MEKQSMIIIAKQSNLCARQSKVGANKRGDLIRTAASVLKKLNVVFCFHICCSINLGTKITLKILKPNRFAKNPL
jgi:hypothetical protein